MNTGYRRCVLLPREVVEVFAGEFRILLAQLDTVQPGRADAAPSTAFGAYRIATRRHNLIVTVPMMSLLGLPSSAAFNQAVAMSRNSPVHADALLRAD